MASSTRTTMTSIISRIPAAERAATIEEIAASLNASSPLTDVTLVATLLESESTPAAREDLVKHLEARVDSGEYDDVLDLCTEFPATEPLLFSRLVDRLADDRQGASSTGHIFVRSSSLTLSEDLANLDKNESAASFLSGVQNRLRFISKCNLTLGSSSQVHELLQSSLLFLGATNKDVCSSAATAIYNLLAAKLLLEQDDHSLVWSRVLELITRGEALHQSLGFSLWLRWIASVGQINGEILNQQIYWTLIVDGLREGDSERRKAALHVLRLSVAAATNSTGHAKHVSFLRFSSDSSPAATQQQYNRFCTVFETIVLSRYLNQVLECEADLDFLSSPQSVVNPVLLHTLLAAALDQKMQDSNRKFIGSWVMRSNLGIHEPEGFGVFFQEAFLPWATQGYLYTTTLKMKDGSLRCLHGEKLSSYVATILRNGQAAFQDSLVGVISNTLYKRQANNFFYAVVYLLGGICQAFESSTAVPLEAAHVEKFAEMARWSGLPEVARDYVLARCWQLCYLWGKHNADGESHDLIKKSAEQWTVLLQKLSSFDDDPASRRSGSIASWTLQPSKRELNEKTAIAKCHTLAADFKSILETNSDPGSLDERLAEIWNDLEYLEYPKNLLSHVPDLILDLNLIEIAVSRLGQQGNSLVAEINRQIHQLIELSASRPWLLSRLMTAMRVMIIESKHFATGQTEIDLAEFILAVINQSPANRIDAFLEDATTSLMPNVDPKLQVLDYEHYFGSRDSRGYAACLDLVSRLHFIGSTDKVFLPLLQRWYKQKTPPPSVSPWKSGLQLQIMVLCAEQYLPQLDLDSVQEILSQLLHILSIENLPTFRYLLEWMIARVLLQHPILRSVILEKLRTKDHHSNPKYIASLMKIGIRLACFASSDEAFALQLATTFVPLAASSKIVIRHEAQWQVPMLLDHARARGWTAVAENPMFGALDDLIRSLERFGDPPLERQIDVFDPIRDHTLTNLVEGSWWALDRVENSKTSRDDFVKLYAADAETLSSHPARPCMPLGDPLPERGKTQSPPKDIDPLSTIHPPSQDPATPTAAFSTLVNPTTLQTKGTAYLIESSHRTPRRHGSLLVIASLVDNPHNLGGLSRAAEIFGAAALYLPNPHITANKDFTAVSVSSHLHLPLRALAPADLPATLHQLKRDHGFQVVGIEQTDRSVLLGHPACLLPPQCILVLGSEREGIPALVLSECDLLVEIPQVGLTRSLNVQTAAAIVLCEYARQHGS